MAIVVVQYAVKAVEKRRTWYSQATTATEQQKLILILWHLPLVEFGTEKHQIPKRSGLKLWCVFKPVYMVLSPGAACLFTMFQIAFIDCCPPHGEKKSSKDSFQHAGQQNICSGVVNFQAAIWQRIVRSTYMWLFMEPYACILFV